MLCDGLGGVAHTFSCPGAKRDATGRMGTFSKAKLTIVSTSTADIYLADVSTVHRMPIEHTSASDYHELLHKELRDVGVAQNSGGEHNRQLPWSRFGGGYQGLAD